jgi:SAM-dependent methyltransferase
MYWLGNAAKTKVIVRVLEECRSGREITIFDYGCGGGGDWPRILSDFPHLRLYGYDINERAAEAARRRLATKNALVFSGGDIHNLNFKADCIVSFSVFEHVYDRGFYLRTAKRLLARHGLFFLNYDDGHFRNVLSLDQPGCWLSQLREWVHKMASPPLARLSVSARYKGRVVREQVDRLVRESGFEVIRAEYSNLPSFKSLYKAIPEDRREEFSRLWLETEEALNSRFLTEEGGELYGDRANLWQQMPSRTLYLRHTSVSPTADVEGRS